jgi:phytoene dehydrogenase-like protein
MADGRAAAASPSARRSGTEPIDVAIVGAGHNGLVAATLLARAGRSVIALERRDQLGGAAVSGTPFPGLGVRLSRYAYLVSLFPAALGRTLGLGLELRPRLDRVVHALRRFRAAGGPRRPRHARVDDAGDG